MYLHMRMWGGVNLHMAVVVILTYAQMHARRGTCVP